MRTTTAGLALALADPATAVGGAPPASAGSGRVPRIGVLGESNPLAWLFHSPRFELECRWAIDSGRRLMDLATELAALDVDALVAVGVRAARAAARVTTTIPIVFVIGGDPVAEGLIASVDKPSRNVTGLRLFSAAELAARRLALLRQTVSGITRLGVLGNPDNPLHAGALVATRRAADVHGIEVHVATIRIAGDRAEDVLLEAFMTLDRAGAEAVLVLPDALFSLHAKELVALAQAWRLPGVYPARSFADAGGLIALHGNSADVVRRVSGLVSQILGGASAASLPVQRLATLEVTINLKSAAALGLTLRPSLLAGADTILT
ncbi:MAG TPA: ABC transporter substrate-binding protein [Longimicrobiales bacterium]|nr:ABC transporter substrate-binding protein [Longimicrobiales bacterium]